MLGLSLLASRLLYQARLLDRVVNDPGPWAVSLCGMSTQAFRELGHDQVVFRTTFHRCLLSGQLRAELRCRDEVVSCAQVEILGCQNDLDLTWTVRVGPIAVPA